MSSAVEEREEVVAAQSDNELEPREAALAEIRSALEAANEEATQARQRATALFRRYVEVEADVKAIRRRRARGFLLSDGTRVFGIEVVADEEREPVRESDGATLPLLF